ncbi:MAG: hypothetical protein ACREE6_02310 [Limisphaerales bacterium]
MSEFKYACPVCGQHIKCDSSQSGTVMECPTCFQKIIVPQAPVGEQTLILTGTKAGGERPAPKNAGADPANSPRRAGISGVTTVIVILVAIILAVAFVYRGTIFKPPNVAANGATNQPNQRHEKKAEPALAAPPANDTNWTLNLKGVLIPSSTAAGRVKGRDFICDRATLQGGLLSLRHESLSISINFAGASPQLLSGKTFSVASNAASAARVTLHWKDGDHSKHEVFNNGYALHLDFGKEAGNRISGKIYLCTSDEQKSYVAGTFKAEIKKPRVRK